MYSITLKSALLFLTFPWIAASQCGKSINLLANLRPSPSSKYLISVHDFGAVGDGQHDDGAAIQETLNCAQQLGDTTVRFDSGVYLVGAQLLAGSWNAAAKIKIVGNNATLKTALQGQALLFLQGYLTNGVIQGITFQNTHPLTATDTRAVEFSGGSQNAVSGWTIEQCTFQDFSRGILVSGVSGLLIKNNEFILDKGRDSGSSNMGDPNVGIWLFNNSPNGTAVDVEIAGNSYNGCGSATLAKSVSKRCGDGFVFGKGSHTLVHNNHIRHFSFEGIYLDRSGSSGIADPKPSSIYENQIDAALVSGDISGGGQWGIRSDDDYTTVLDNTITSAVNGIWVYGVTMPTQIAGSVITGNQVYMSSNPAEPVGAGIFLANVSGPNVSSNVVVFASSTLSGGPEAQGIYLTGDNASQPSVSATITGNQIVCYAHPIVGAFTGIFLQWSSKWTIASNSVSGCTDGFHLMNFGNTLPSTAALSGSNTLSGNLQPVQVTN